MSGANSTNPPKGALIAVFCAALFCACSGDEDANHSNGNGSGSGARADTAWFREVAAERGLDFVHRRYDKQHHWVPEISAGGIALFDFDGDGSLDLYCVQSGSLEPPGSGPQRNKLYKGDGNGYFTDVTEGSGVDDTNYGHGVCTGDYDGDGDLDLYVTNLGPNTLYRNDGAGHFTDVTDTAGVPGEGWSAGCAFVDYDLDGDYDLFVVNNLNWTASIERVCRTSRGEKTYCAPLNYDAPSTETLYRNDGDGTFTDVSKAVGLYETSGTGWGVGIADFNGDTYPDFYVTNDGMPNALWYSDGKGGFVDDAQLSGCAVNNNGRSEAGMGVQVIDIKNDGNWDLFMTHVRDESNTFYMGKGGGFSDKSAASGLAHTSMKYTGFGMGFHDFDLDGWLDLFIANGRVTLVQPVMRQDAPYAEPNQLYRGLGNGKFEELASPTAEPQIATSRATAFGDIDNDGDVDICYIDSHESVKLLENNTPRVGGWVGFRLLDRRGSEALGSVLHLELEGDCAVPVQNKVLQTSYSFCAANDPRVHFGCGSAQAVAKLVVTWPDGSSSTHGPFELGQYHTLRQATD